jgi:hypothetical protein
MQAATWGSNHRRRLCGGAAGATGLRRHSAEPGGGVAVGAQPFCLSPHVPATGTRHLLVSGP